jgi:hypothetical protein
MSQDYTEVIVRYGRAEPCHHCHWNHQCDVPNNVDHGNIKHKTIMGVFRCFDFTPKGTKPTHEFGA